MQALAHQVPAPRRPSPISLAVILVLMAVVVAAVADAIWRQYGKSNWRVGGVQWIAALVVGWLWVTTGSWLYARRRRPALADVTSAGLLLVSLPTAILAASVATSIVQLSLPVWKSSSPVFDQPMWPSMAFAPGVGFLWLPRKVLVRGAQVMNRVTAIVAVIVLALLCWVGVLAARRPSAELYVDGLQQCSVDVQCPGFPKSKSDCDRNYVCSTTFIGDSGKEPAAEDYRHTVWYSLFKRPTLLRDEQTGLIYLCEAHGADQKLVPENGEWWTQPHDPTSTTRYVSPPTLWVGLAALGVLVAGALVVLRLQSVPRASDFEGTDGVLLSDGSLHIPGAPILWVDSMGNLLPGAVIVQGKIPRAMDAFRDRLLMPKEMISPGSVTAQREEAALLGLRYDMAILAVLAITAAPLAGCAMTGMLLP
jgi:hypothetical protein